MENFFLKYIILSNKIKDFVMTALLYYSMSSDLTADEIIEIDRQIAENRETVCFFVRNLASML
jgi:hypothetical protein